jgi:CheY-specific phosphatase CheX
MKFAEVELRQIAEETWKIVLEEHLEHQLHFIAPENIEDSIAACAQITGDWQLAVALICPVSAAWHAATAMFATVEAEQRPEDVEDAMCELINIISGNVKGVLSGSSHLSLPSLVKGMDFKLMFPRHLLLSEIHFAYRGEPVCVMLLGEDKLASSRERTEVAAGL